MATVGYGPRLEEADVYDECHDVLDCIADGNTHTHAHAHAHTHTLPFNRLTALCLGINIHPLTPVLIVKHPLSTSSIYYDP